MEAFLGALLMLVIFVLIFVAISRWVFRINDIVKRLDQIIDLLGKENKKLENN
jgi:hypothetical protein